MFEFKRFVTLFFFSTHKRLKIQRLVRKEEEGSVEKVEREGRILVPKEKFKTKKN